MTPVADSTQWTIGTLAQRVGLNVSAIRYYEEVGLIPPALRKPSGHRVYSEQAHATLTLIRRCRDMGFSVEETRKLVALSTSQGSDCVQARAIAQVHLDAVRLKLQELQVLERNLGQFITACTAQCLGGPAPQCVILEDLALDDSLLARSQVGKTTSGCCG
jgi:DNA-binding transcriptional MerR regulator